MSATKKVNKPILMYNDEATYKYFKAVEDKCRVAIDKLTLMADVSIKEGAIEDYSEFLENPMEYMTQAYWNQWGVKYNPPHADKYAVFVNSSNISASDVRAQTEDYLKASKELSKRAPIVGKSIVYNVKKEDFDVYVNEDRMSEYKATANLVKALKAFQKEMGSNDNFHVCRWSNHNIDTNLDIKYYNFK